MAEQKPTEQEPSSTTQTEASPAPQPITNKQVREHKLFIDMAKRVTDMEGVVKDLRAQQEQAAQAADVAAAAEQGRLKEELERVLAERKAAEADIHAKYQAQMTEHEIRMAAAQRGVQSDILLDGIVARYGKLEEKPESVGDWVAALAGDEANAHLFGAGQQTQTQTQAIGSPPAGAAASRGGGSETLQDRLRRMDKSAIADALRKAGGL